jgi:phytoene dehydrogenase-like protein
MAGIAAAIAAAREGAAVALVQDRPVLGGNASTEVRVGLEGANGGAHNRFFVEPNLTLYLDTFVHDVACDFDRRVTDVHAHTLASERAWTFSAPYFVDATGDGTIAYLAGAEYM